MSTKEPKKVLGLNQQKVTEYSDLATHNILGLQTITHEHSGIGYPLYVQPFESWNEYGIRDPANPDSSLLEVYSMHDEEDNSPWIQAWWKTKLNPVDFLRTASQFLKDLDSLTGTTSNGLVLVRSPSKNWQGMNLVHTRHFDMPILFSVDDLASVHASYYEAMRPSDSDNYGWPFTLNDASFLSIYNRHIGELRYDRENEVAGFSSPKTTYGNNSEIFINAVENYCQTSQTAFPASLFRSVFEHVTYDPYQS